MVNLVLILVHNTICIFHPCLPYLKKSANNKSVSLGCLDLKGLRPCFNMMLIFFLDTVEFYWHSAGFPIIISMRLNTVYAY